MFDAYVVKYLQRERSRNRKAERRFKKLRVSPEGNRPKLVTKNTRLPAWFDDQSLATTYKVVGKGNS